MSGRRLEVPLSKPLNCGAESAGDEPAIEVRSRSQDMPPRQSAELSHFENNPFSLMYF